ncbi:hypothetical protein JHK82_040125 [Glycine max]|nr:hypothetical protein JHK82_040125 [Glycine max]
MREPFGPALSFAIYKTQSIIARSASREIHWPNEEDEKKDGLTYLNWEFAAIVVGQNLKLEPLKPEKKAMWRREMNCLLSVCDYILEFSSTAQYLEDGTIVEGYSLACTMPPQDETPDEVTGVRANATIHGEVTEPRGTEKFAQASYSSPRQIYDLVLKAPIRPGELTIRYIGRLNWTRHWIEDKFQHRGLDWTIPVVLSGHFFQ